MPGNAAWEDVAAAETKGNNTDKLEGPDVNKAAAEGISKSGERGTREPRRDATPLRDTATDDSGAHDPGDVTASTPLRRTLRFRKKNQKIKGF